MKKKPTLENAREEGRKLGETLRKVDDYFADQERLKKRPWWKKLLGIK